MVTPFCPGTPAVNPPGRTVLEAPPRAVLSLRFLTTMNMIAAVRISMTVVRIPITRPMYCFGSEESLKLDDGGTVIEKYPRVRSNSKTAQWIANTNICVDSVMLLHGDMRPLTRYLVSILLQNRMIPK